MAVLTGDIVLYTPSPTSRHLLPPWYVRFLDGAFPHTGGPAPTLPRCAAIVGGRTESGQYALLVLAPNRAPVWVDDVEEGPGVHQFEARERLTPRSLLPNVAANDLAPEPSDAEAT